MQRLPNPMVTPTVQYEGTIEGNHDAMTAPGSDNFIPPAQNFTTPVDLVPTKGRANMPVNLQADRIRDNPAVPDQHALPPRTPGPPGSPAGGGWVYTGTNDGGWKTVT